MVVSGGTGSNKNSVEGSRRRARETRERSERKVHVLSDSTFFGIDIGHV